LPIHLNVKFGHIHFVQWKISHSVNMRDNSTIVSDNPAIVKARRMRVKNSDHLSHSGFTSERSLARNKHRETWICVDEICECIESLFKIHSRTYRTWLREQSDPWGSSCHRFQIRMVGPITRPEGNWWASCRTPWFVYCYF
jgi:hypothetical protein